MIGDAGNAIMAVLEGRVRISIQSADDREVVLAVLEAEEFFGEIAMLDGRERSADATAATNCTLAVLTRQDVFGVLQQNPDMWANIALVLCERLRHTTEQMTEIALMDVPTRLERAVLRQASLARGTSDRDRLHLQLSQRQLGNLIGTTRESVNKCLRKWQRDRIVSISDGAMTVLDPARLEALAGI